MPAAASPEARVCVGAVAGAHGVRGAVRIKPFTEMPEDVAAYGALTDEAGDRTFRLTLTGTWKGGVLGSLDGVTTREEAEALKGLRLYIPRARLPAADPDEFYHADLIGLAVELADGTAAGTVRALHDFGAGDLLEVGLPEGRPVLVPFTRDCVPHVDVAGGRLVIDPPPGLLEDTDPPPKGRKSG